MQIQVKVFATLVDFVPGARAGIPFDFELAEGSSLADLTRALQIPEKEVKMTFVNGRMQALHHQLKSADDVGIFPPIGGG